MSHKQFICAYETTSLGYLISTPKALGMLLVHKIRDAGFSYSCGGGHSFSLQSSAHALADSIFCRPSWLQAFLLQALACLQYRFGWEQATCCWNSPWRISDSSSWRPNAGLYLYFKIRIFLYPSRRTEFDCGQRSNARRRATALSSRQSQTCHL